MADEILVVDDEADIRMLISGILADEGYAVREGGHSDEALEAIASRVDLRSRCEVTWTEIMRAITPDHAVLINRQNRRGSMIQAGMSMFILETEPAGYAWRHFVGVDEQRPATLCEPLPHETDRKLPSARTGRSADPAGTHGGRFGLRGTNGARDHGRVCAETS